MRILLFEIAVFALPFAIYVLYVVALNKKEDGDSFWKNAPIFNLILTGLLLVAAGILGYGLYWS